MAIGGKLDAQMSEINVTPFVDVMLVLLVIFMVTAPLMQRGLDIQLPQAKAGTMKYKDDQLMLIVTKDGQVRLQDQTLSLPQLATKLSAIVKNNKAAEVYLSADKNARYGAVVEVMAAVKNAGISRLGMVTEQPSPEGKGK